MDVQSPIISIEVEGIGSARDSRSKRISHSRSMLIKSADHTSSSPEGITSFSLSFF